MTVPDILSKSDADLPFPLPFPLMAGPSPNAGGFGDWGGGFRGVTGAGGANTPSSDVEEVLLVTGRPESPGLVTSILSSAMNGLFFSGCLLLVREELEALEVLDELDMSRLADPPCPSLLSLRPRESDRDSPRLSRESDRPSRDSPRLSRESRRSPLSLELRLLDRLSALRLSSWCRLSSLLLSFLSSLLSLLPSLLLLSPCLDLLPDDDEDDDDGADDLDPETPGLDLLVGLALVEEGETLAISVISSWS